MEEILSVQNLTKYFTNKGIFSSSKIVKAVDGISFSLKKGEVLVLAGESGSGKTTISRLILRAIEPDSGTIFFDGVEVTRESRNLDKLRKQCQIIYQDPYAAINPRMKVSEIIMEPLQIHKIGTTSERKKIVLDVLHEVRLEPAEIIYEKYPHMLSGGQRQRIVLARALVTKPEVIIADEPVSMLDVSVRAEILELMREIQEKHGISYIYITHDLSTARYLGQRIAIMYLGKIVESGPINEVLFHPKHPYTQALTDAISEPNPDNLYQDKKIRINEPVDIDVYEGCRFRSRCPYVIEKCKDEPPLDQVEKDRFAACFVKIN
ncbi:MAG TPA: ABC transporter ATP-binding protein [Nitrosopumilaceae archaeon]|nr:ABC transporter ATP-binding protein [Nitrosopumilaceae archaeon]